MRDSVVNVPVIDQSDQHIDIQQKPHGHSSRRRFTISIVTGFPPGRLGSKGTPLRVRKRLCGGSRPFLASPEMTSPTLFPSLSARPLAAARTSSSMASVVLMHQSSSINHRMSKVKLLSPPPEQPKHQRQCHTEQDGSPQWEIDGCVFTAPSQVAEHPSGSPFFPSRRTTAPTAAISRPMPIRTRPGSLIDSV